MFLPICLGEATKIIPFLKNSKTYIAEVTLGIATTTEDHEGEIVEKKEVTTPPTDEAIEATLKKFTGNNQTSSTDVFCGKSKRKKII